MKFNQIGQVCPDTNSRDLMQVAQWLDAMKVESVTVINNRAVARNPHGFYVEKHKRAVGLTEAAHLVKSAWKGK